MFIVFEGIDGAGKSTLSRIVRDKLLEKNLKVFLDCEPTNQSEAGIKIRSILKNNKAVKSDDLYDLFLQDRFAHQKILKQRNEDCDVILLDRYFLSSMAYQVNGLSLGQIWQNHQDFILPNIIFYLELSVNQALNRIQTTRSNINFFETKEKLNAIFENYQKAITFINDNSSIKIVSLQAEDSLENLVNCVINKLK